MRRRMLPVLVMVVSLSVAAPCHSDAGAVSLTSTTEHTSSSFWLIGGAVGWFQVGIGAGLAVAAVMPHRTSVDSAATFGAAAAIGAAAGAGLGLLLGWAASRDWLPAQLAVAAPLLVDLIALVVAGGIFGAHGGGCGW